MKVSRSEILGWMKVNKDGKATILDYAIAHDMTPQEVIDMMNCDCKVENNIRK